MSNIDIIKAALREHSEEVIDHVAERIAHLGSKSEWSMDDNFETTEGVARLAEEIGLGPVGNQTSDSLAFYRQAVRDG